MVSARQRKNQQDSVRWVANNSRGSPEIYKCQAKMRLGDCVHFPSSSRIPSDLLSALFPNYKLHFHEHYPQFECPKGTSQTHSAKGCAALQAQHLGNSHQIRWISRTLTESLQWAISAGPWLQDQRCKARQSFSLRFKVLETATVCLPDLMSITINLSKLSRFCR